MEMEAAREQVFSELQFPAVFKVQHPPIDCLTQLWQFEI